MNEELFNNEPVAVINGITTVIEAGLALGVAFGLGLSAEQVGAVMAFVVAISALIRTMIVRSRVTPVANPHNNAGQPLEPAAAAVPPANPISAPGTPA